MRASHANSIIPCITTLSMPKLSSVGSVSRSVHTRTVNDWSPHIHAYAHTHTHVHTCTHARMHTYAYTHRQRLVARPRQRHLARHSNDFLEVSARSCTAFLRAIVSVKSTAPACVAIQRYVSVLAVPDVCVYVRACVCVCVCACVLCRHSKLRKRPRCRWALTRKDKRTPRE